MSFIEISPEENEPENKEMQDKLASVYKAVEILKKDLYLLDPSERAVLVKHYINEVSPKEVAMSIYYGNTKRGIVISKLIQKEDHAILEDMVDKVLK